MLVSGGAGAIQLRFCLGGVKTLDTPLTVPQADFAGKVRRPPKDRSDSSHFWRNVLE
jgi:hypothetical protein